MNKIIKFWMMIFFAYLCLALFPLPDKKIQPVFSPPYILAGRIVEIETDNGDILERYQHDSYPVPAEILPYLERIVIIPQDEINQIYSNQTSGYTETYFTDGICNGSTIYLSDTLFRETTLLHESLHVSDAYFSFSSSKQFLEIMKNEMDIKYNDRIYTYYDEAYHSAEYFVESYINLLHDEDFFYSLQPQTWQYINDTRQFLLKNISF